MPTLVSPIGGGGPSTSIHDLKRSESDNWELDELSRVELFRFVARGNVLWEELDDWPISSISWAISDFSESSF